MMRLQYVDKGSVEQVHILKTSMDTVIFCNLGICFILQFQALFIEVPVHSQESERSCICV